VIKSALVRAKFSRLIVVRFSDNFSRYGDFYIFYPLIADLLFHSVQEPSTEGPFAEPAALLPGGDADDQGGAGERAEPGAARHTLH